MLHVHVLHPERESETVDMFVDAAALFKRLALNVEATRLYRAAHMKFHPGDDPDELPTIAGAAVLFMRRVILGMILTNCPALSDLLCCSFG
jgi:hypothetical protein